MVELNNVSISVLLSVAETGSYTKTASELHFSMQAIRRHIRYMEERLGGQLIVWNGRRMEATPLGAEYVKFYREYLDGLERVKEDILRASDRINHRLRIALSVLVTGAASLIPVKIAAAVDPAIVLRGE